MDHLIFTLTLASTVSGQSRTTKTKAPLPTIVGTWRLIEFTDLDAKSGQWMFRYGKHPKGYFTYTKSGVVNLNISRENPPKISEDSVKKTVVNLFDFPNMNALGYFGTYTVDVKKSIVTHHVTGGSLPWYVDTDQERPFSMKGDTLIIGNHKSWKRVLVRVD